MTEPQPGAYEPFQSLRRPGGPPDFGPRFRVLVHRRYARAWANLAVRASEERLQQCWDHLALNANRPAEINSTTKLRGRKFAATADGRSAVLHYRISRDMRLDYRFHPGYTAGKHGDPHPVVFIEWIGQSTSGT